MSNTIRNVIFPNMVGIGLMVVGWYISLLNVGLSRFQSTVLFTRWTFLGLVLIIIGAYMPRIWTKISQG